MDIELDADELEFFGEIANELLGDEPRFEYRLGWSAFSNNRFHGKTAWMPWEGWEETATEVEVAIERGDAQLSPGLEQVIEASGFEWYAEVREVGTDG